LKALGPRIAKIYKLVQNVIQLPFTQDKRPDGLPWVDGRV